MTYQALYRKYRPKKFEDFIDVYYSLYSLNVPCVVITNGHWIIDNQEKVLQMLDKYPGLFFQVTYDSRYYPKKLDLTKRILRQEHIVVVTSVDNIIPIGRAKDSNDILLDHNQYKKLFKFIEEK